MKLRQERREATLYREEVEDRKPTDPIRVAAGLLRTPVALGRLRASRRKADPKRSKPHRPWHRTTSGGPLNPASRWIDCSGSGAYFACSIGTVSFRQLLNGGPGKRSNNNRFQHVDHTLS
jgi:hypothetical protein